MNLRLRLTSTTIAVVGLLMAMPSPASAVGCGDVPEDGVCIDKQTMSWCEEDKVKSVKCPEGELCVEQTPWVDAAGCVAPSDTDCGDITTEGECTTANAVVWCEEGTPMVRTCEEGSVCGWDDVNGWYDCLSGASEGDLSFSDSAAENPEADESEASDALTTAADADEQTDANDAQADTNQQGESTSEQGQEDDDRTEPSDDNDASYIDDPTIPSPGIDRGLSHSNAEQTAAYPYAESNTTGCKAATGSNPTFMWLISGLVLLGLFHRRTQRLI